MLSADGLMHGLCFAVMCCYHVLYDTCCHVLPYDTCCHVLPYDTCCHVLLCHRIAVVMCHGHCNLCNLCYVFLLAKLYKDIWGEEQAVETRRKLYRDCLSKVMSFTAMSIQSQSKTIWYLTYGFCNFVFRLVLDT
ncbi:hypothetical protein U1Q18_015598 [Sarracenia purpurea var. burkii]